VYVLYIKYLKYLIHNYIYCITTKYTFIDDDIESYDSNSDIDDEEVEVIILNINNFYLISKI